MFRNFRPFLIIWINLFSLCIGWSQTLQEKELKIVTGELPPYAYTKDQRIQGIATEIVNELVIRTGHPGNIKMLPWARAIMESTYDMHLTYPLARLPYRETMYQWIGPILSDWFSFAVLESNRQIFSAFESFRQLEIGVNRGAPTEKRLRENGFQNLFSMSSESKNAQMLLHGKFDAWYTTTLMIPHTMMLLGEDENQIRIAFTDIQINMYIVASLDTPEEYVREWQTQLEAMKNDGTYNAILRKYNIFKD